MVISLRSATGEDAEFLWSLHRETMREYVDRTWGWDDSWQRERFFDRFDPAGRQIIEVDGVAAGLLQVDRGPDYIFVANIEISSGYQRRGIGTQLIESLIKEAKERGVPIRLQVLRVNPARRLYERLGFRETRSSPTHIHMEWKCKRGPSK